MSERSMPPSDTEILKSRARALARRATADARAAFSLEALSFTLGREHFAIETRYVFAVFPLPSLVPLPGATVPVIGLTRWRGDVLTLLDLRRLIGVSPGALDDLARVIVVGASAPDFGLLADTVSDIVAIDPTTMHGVSQDRAGESSRLLRGVTNTGVHVLDAATLIARQADTAPVATEPPA